ncbi:MAG: VanW family protein [Clostridium sp.]|nr:VanW family protein [Clostridium sp.]
MENNNLNTEPSKEVIEQSKVCKFLKSKTFIIISSIILILSIAIGYWFYSNNKLINSYSNKVYPGVSILGTDLSGLSSEELHATLISLFNNIENKQITVTAKDEKFNTTYKDLGSAINITELENSILSYGKNESFFNKVSLIKEPVNKEYELSVTFNEDKINSFVDKISNAINYNPKNASINIAGGRSIVNDQPGLKLNSEELLNNIKSCINDINSPEISEITGNVETVEANITASELSTVNKKISSYTTNFTAGPSGTNLSIAARNINNSIIMPGETFSTEQAIGPTTIENGFVEANTYVGGEVVKGVGGGVCQVASTLYNTMLKAGIIPTERLNHMMPVSYVPLGLDATLADNLIDLKFVNEFDYPIVINSYTANGKLTVEFWSNETVNQGMTYEAVSVPLNSLSADAYLYGYNSNGELVVNQYLDRSTYQPLP